jgi:hypothetical protein
VRISYEDDSRKGIPIPLSDNQAWMRPLVTKITGLSTYFRASPDRDTTINCSDYYHNLLERVHKLKQLSVVGTDANWWSQGKLDPRLILEENRITPKFTSLTSLLLTCVDLSKSYRTLFSNLEPSNLRTLSTILCDHTAVFLNALLEYYATQGSEQLSDLEICFPYFEQTNPVDFQATELFLRTGPRVTKLVLDVAENTLLDKDYIIAQSSNLTSLRVGSLVMRPAPHYAVDDTKAVLNARQKLRYIAIDLPEMRLGSISDMGEDFRLGRDQNGVAHVETEFESMLVSRRTIYSSQFTKFTPTRLP